MSHFHPQTVRNQLNDTDMRTMHVNDTYKWYVVKRIVWRPKVLI